MISVLYVDDESALLEGTKNLMERGGEFTVDTAISAREAIEKLKAGRYDALVADYLMPEMDGLALLRYLRPRCNGMPFILFTGNGGEDVAIEALNSGADFYVQKKGSPRSQVAELEARIRSAVARRQSELTLRTSEERFRVLVEQIEDAVFTVNEEGIITYVSSGIRRFGHEPKDMTGRDFAMLVCAEDIPTVAHGFGEVKQGATRSFGFRITGGDGRVHRVRVTFRPRTDYGKFAGAGGEITDDTGAENGAEKHEGRVWEDLFDQASSAQLTLSPDGRVTGVNRAGARLLGAPAGEIAGKNLAEFFGQDEGMRLLACIAGTGSSGSACEGRFFLRPREGGQAIVSLDSTVIRGSDGEICRILATLTDITGQETKEAALRALAATAGAIINGAREGIVVCAPDLHITGWNPALEDITGIAAPDALGQPLAGKLPFLQGTEADAPVRALAGEIVATPDIRYEYPATGKQGWLRILFSPLREPSGEITGVVGVVQEITARTKTFLKIKAERRLYAIGAQVTSSAAVLRELETLLSETCKMAVDGDTVCMAWIGLFDQAAGILRRVAQTGAGKELPKEGYAVTGEASAGCLAGEAIRTGVPLVCPDVTTDPVAQPWRDDALLNGYRSQTAIPFRLKGEIVGVMTLCSREPLAFSPENTDVLVYLGATLSSALDLLDKKTLQRRAGKGGRGSWERTRFLAGGIEFAALPFAAVHTDGSTGAVNTALCSLLGSTEEDLLAQPFTSILGSPEIDGNRFRRVLATQRPEQYESAARRKDGTLVPVEVFLQAIPDETSGQPCVGIFLADISEKTQHADALEKDLLKYRTILEETPAAMVIATLEGRILSANPAACRLLGRTEKELSLTGRGGLAGDGDPRFIELVRACGESGNATGEMRLIRADATTRDVYVEARRFPDQDGRPALGLVLRDITGTRVVGDAQAQELMAALSLIDRLPVPVRVTGDGDTGTYFNRAWYAFTGRTPAQEQDRGWTEGIHPEDRALYQHTSKMPADRAGPILSEYRLMHRSGEYRWIQEICVPATHGGRCICVCSDIHAFRLAEEASRYERMLYQAVLETMTDAALLIGDRDRILGGNTAAARLLGCDRAELAGQDLFAYAPLNQPDGRPSAAAAQQYLAAARSGTSQAFPWTYTGSTGPAREAQVTLTPVEWAGGRQILAVITDKTELIRASREIRHLSAFAEMNPHPVIEAGADRTIAYANPATTAVLSGIGLPVNPEIFLPADFDRIVSTLKQEPRKKTECVVQLKERSFHETLCLSPGQDLVRIYAYDVTDRVQAAEALAYANHKLGILTSITRHDIQNKLTGVMGYLDLLRGSLRDPQLVGFLEKAEASADAIRHHIEFTRDYESLGGIAPVWQEITPILADIRSHFDLGTIAFEEPAAGFSVFADPMFAKVIYNLVDNSLRHGVHVRRIRLDATPCGDGGCTLTYEDDGVGISPDKKEIIFERGFTTSSGPGKSSGLGLFLVRDILAITGIAIKETGVPGSGSRFEMSVPPGKWRNRPAE